MRRLGHYNHGMKKSFFRFELRLPPELRDTLKKAAAENHRSLHGEVIHRLVESLKVEKQAKPRVK